MSEELFGNKEKVKNSIIDTIDNCISPEINIPYLNIAIDGEWGEGKSFFI